MGCCRCKDKMKRGLEEGRMVDRAEMETGKGLRMVMEKLRKED